MQAVNGLIGVSKLSGLTSPDYSIYTTKSDFNDEYYGVLLKQPKYLSEYSKVVTGVMEGFIRLYTDDLFSIYTHVPPLEEQVQIVNYLEKIHEKFDKVLNQIEMELDSLSEYKVTMINNAVTGKIKVSLDAKCDR
jgi:type I restriction enzyme S subunit